MCNLKHKSLLVIYWVQWSLEYTPFNNLVRVKLFISVISLLQLHLPLKTIQSMKEVWQSLHVMVQLEVLIDNG